MTQRGLAAGCPLSIHLIGLSVGRLSLLSRMEGEYPLRGIPGPAVDDHIAPEVSAVVPKHPRLAVLFDPNVLWPVSCHSGRSQPTGGFQREWGCRNRLPKLGDPCSEITFPSRFGRATHVNPGMICVGLDVFPRTGANGEVVVEILQG